jgi:opacity protein-like surface antigen
VGYVTIKQQTGISGGATIHVTENIHIALEYFRAMFQWYRPTPALAGTTNPKQNFHVVNAGVTYAW